METLDICLSLGVGMAGRFIMNSELNWTKYILLTAKAHTLYLRLVCWSLSPPKLPQTIWRESTPIGIRHTHHECDYTPLPQIPSFCHSGNARIDKNLCTVWEIFMLRAAAYVFHVHVKENAYLQQCNGTDNQLYWIQSFPSIHALNETWPHNLRPRSSPFEVYHPLEQRTLLRALPK